MIIKWIATRLGEKSTWVGLITLLSVVGVQLNPEMQAQIVQLGLSAGGVLLMITKG